MSQAHGRAVVVLGVVAALGAWAVEGATIYEFPIPTNNSRPTGIAAGPDGNLWFTEYAGNKIGRITPAGVITEFPIPSFDSRPESIAAGPDGNLWFTETERNKIGRITTEGVITEFSLSGLAGRTPYGIAAGYDGNLWFTLENGSIGRITTDGVASEFPLASATASPVYVTAGPDTNVWFTEKTGNKVGKITPTGTITEYTIPQVFSTPAGIASGSDGNVWFAEQAAGGRIGRVTIGGVFTEFATPGGTAPYSLAAGPDGNVWYTSRSAHKLGRVTPTGTMTEYVVPTANGQPHALTAGPDGNIWFTENSGNKIGKLVTAPAKGDIDGDGRSDLLFRNLADETRNRVWFMDGAARLAQANIVPDAPSPDWILRGADDFDGAHAPGGGRDRVTDLVFWNRVTGQVEFWLMDGPRRIGSPAVLGGAVLPTSWDLSATAEFDKDGMTDLVWRDFVSQDIVIWKMAATVKAGEIVPVPSRAIDANWIIVAAADYDHDSHTDFLWYNESSGKIVTWYMDANVVRKSGQFTAPPAAGDANWKVVASADYSSGSRPTTSSLGAADIVWRNATSGNQVVWHMDFGSARVAGEFTSPVANTTPLDWVIAGPR